MSDPVAMGLFALVVFATVAMLCFVWYEIGRDTERIRRARRDIKDAARLRAAIREDDP